MVGAVELVDCEAGLEGAENDALGVVDHFDDLGGPVLHLGLLAGGVHFFDGLEDGDGLLLVPLDDLVDPAQPVLWRVGQVDVVILGQLEVVEGQAGEVVEREPRGVELPSPAQLVQPVHHLLPLQVDQLARHLFAGFVGLFLAAIEGLLELFCRAGRRDDGAGVVALAVASPFAHGPL